MKGKTFNIEKIKSVLKNNYRKTIFVGIGFFGLLSITVFASNSNNKLYESDELYYDLSYYYNNRVTTKDSVSILPMNEFKASYFAPGDENLNITSNSSYYLNYEDVEKSNVPTENYVAKNIYLQQNKDLIEQNYNNVYPNKVAYLTFDDGPSKNTIEIMEILNKYNIKGTFFFIGSNMEENKELVKNVIDNGHMVGLHSFSHNYKKLYSTSEGLIEDFNQSQDIYNEITGEETKIIRLPFGSKPTLDAEDVENLTKEGFKFWDWNIDSNDSNSKGKTKEKVIKSVQKGIDSDKNELVILMHEKNQTVDALEEIIINLKKAGYTIKPITTYTDAYNNWNVK